MPFGALVVGGLLVAAGARAWPAAAQQPPHPYVSPPVVPKVQPARLDTLAPPRDGPVVGDDVPPRVVPEGGPEPQPTGPNPPPRPDPVRQASRGAGDRGPDGRRGEAPGVPGGGESAVRISDPLVSFEGIGYTGRVPPDTVGDVGPGHYVQAVNRPFAVYDKGGTLLAGPAGVETLWAGAGGKCEAQASGDPIVLYDQAADRWLVSQMANEGDGPETQCIAISRTGDPVGGGWYLYEFALPDDNDYPKFGVWPDAYYMSTYEGSTLGALAFDRARMLDGLAASFQYFSISSLTGTRQTRILPADWDGERAPPAGAPNPFVRSVDGAVQGGEDRLELFEFRVDWAAPTGSSFTLRATLPTAPFDSSMCGFSRECVYQPGTDQRIDTLSNRLMHRLQYRNFGGDERLVVNQTVDVGDFNDHAGVRWYELGKAGGSWEIRQQSTYAPDAHHRFMGSAAMDGAGNIAVGYSVSSQTVHPGARYAGRLLGDLPNRLAHGEKTLVAGGGAQTNSDRWGDYSALTVDPTDDCTFWYTQEYVPAGATRWRTRIGSFRFPSCLSGPPPNDRFTQAAPLPLAAGPPAGAAVDTAAALAEPGEPTAVDAGCGGSGPGTLGHTAWSTYTAAVSAPVTVSTAGSNFDTVVAVYTGGALGALTRVACNDDAAGAAQAVVTFAATAGTTYRIQVGGFDAASGDLVLGATPVPLVSVADAATPEGTGGTSTLTFAVTLAIPPVREATVRYATSDGTATGGPACSGGVDYLPAGGTLTFRPGDTSRTISVTVCADATAEVDETLTVTLASPTDALLDRARATGTIRNDDAAQPPSTACANPRPSVRVAAHPAGGALAVTVATSPRNDGSANPIRAIRFDAATNARISIGGTTTSGPYTFTPTEGRAEHGFVVARVAPGQPATVPFTVVDSCGEWRTFVGGGPDAGF